MTGPINCTWENLEKTKKQQNGNDEDKRPIRGDSQQSTETLLHLNLKSILSMNTERKKT